MAVFIRNTNNLLSLSVGLAQSRAGSSVRFRLYRGRELLHELRDTAESIGVPRSLTVRRLRQKPIPEELPSSLLDDVEGAVSSSRTGGEPLWLLLERSTPHLGALPWERMLRRRIDVPILRIPNIAVDPIFLLGKLNLVVCASSPRAKPGFDVSEAVQTVVHAALGAVPAGCRVHVFCDQRYYHQLQGRFESGVTLYDPQDSTAYGADPEEGVIPQVRGGIVSPWLHWMVDTLRGVPVDAVHCICPGYFLHDQGALALAQSPTVNENRRWSHFVGVGELTTFLDRLGAWSLGLSAPRHDIWVVGLRLLAESLTYSRPGPVLLDDFGALPGLDPLDATFGFLYAPEHREAPNCRELTLYCHPRRLEEYADPEADLLAGSRHAAVHPAQAGVSDQRTRELLMATRASLPPAPEQPVAENTEMIEAWSRHSSFPVARRSNRLVLDRAIAKYAKMAVESPGEDARADGAASAIRFVADLLGQPDLGPGVMLEPPDFGIVDDEGSL